MSETDAGSPLTFTRRAVDSAWKTLLTIYYADSIPWRILKSGGLFFLGAFLWAGSNVLLSYLDGVRLLEFTRSYGFVLIVYGPFHHLVVIPIYQRLRRAGTHLSLGGHLHLPNLSLLAFLVLVVALTVSPIGLMAIDFQSALEDSGADITPDLACVKNTNDTGATVIHCHLSESEGVDQVVVESGSERLVVDDDPPFEFTFRADALRKTGGSDRFRVDLLAADGSLVRRYTRTLGMIDEG
jgi:hypothetical protein